MTCGRIPLLSRFGLVAGLLLFAMGVLRMGRMIEFVPYPVTTGFTAGIAVVIATLQLKDLLGLEISHMPEHFVERVQAIALALPGARAPDLALRETFLAWQRVVEAREDLDRLIRI